MPKSPNNPQEPNTPVLKDIGQPDGEAQVIVPGDVNADKDHFKDIDKQAELKQRLDQELSTAPYNKNASH